MNLLTKTTIAVVIFISALFITLIKTEERKAKKNGPIRKNNS